MELNKKFKFFIPEVDIEKATDSKGQEKMIFKGVASTTQKDTDGQTLDPRGFDLSFFKDAGFINWNHQAKNNPSAIIGEPMIARINANNEFYIEAELYADSKLARETYELADTLKKNSKSRKLGWSVEGKTLATDPLNPSKVTRALITGIAVTPTPKNGGTWLDLLKGELIDEDYIYENEEELEKGEQGTILDENAGKENGGTFYLIDITKPNGDRIVVDNEFNLKIISKAMSTDGSGAALKKEDVEGELKFPKEIVKAILTLTSGYQEGLIDEQVFLNEIKPAILAKMELIKGEQNKEEIVEIIEEQKDYFENEEDLEKANGGDPIGTVKKFKFRNEQREYEKQADGKWSMLAKKIGDNWVTKKQLDKEEKLKQKLINKKEQRLPKIDTEIDKIGKKIDSFVNKLSENFGEEFELLCNSGLPKEQAYYFLLGKHGGEEMSHLYDKINNIDEFLIDHNLFHKNTEDYFHTKLAEKFPNTDFEF